jgi:dihydrolipoamide dehydrogenase
VGRVPALDGFGLEKAGIKFEKRQLTVNDRLQTTNPNVYAAGDVTLQTRLAHAASVQGEVAAKNALGGSEIFDGSLVPRCLYSWPEVASVGRWKYELEAENKPVKTSRAFFKGSAKALAAGEADGFVQIVSDPGSGRLLGAQIIGPHATELIHVFSVALKAKMSIADFNSVIFAHPTLSETLKDAARK